MNDKNSLEKEVEKKSPVKNIEFNIFSSMRKTLSKIPSQENILLNNFNKSKYMNKLIYKNHNFPAFHQSTLINTKRDMINSKDKNHNNSLINNKSVISDINILNTNQINLRQFILYKVNKTKIPPGSLNSSRRKLKATNSYL